MPEDKSKLLWNSNSLKKSNFFLLIVARKIILEAKLIIKQNYVLVGNMLCKKSGKEAKKLWAEL